MKIIRNLSGLLFISFSVVSCQDYGKKVVKGPIEVYFKEGITEGQAMHTADLFAYIDSAQNNNTKQTRSFQLCKKNDTCCFRMVSDKDKLAMVPENSFFVIGDLVSDSIFNSAPVNVELTNIKFETFKTFPYKKAAMENTDSPQQ